MRQNVRDIEANMMTSRIRKECRLTLDLLATIKERIRQSYPEMADVEPSAVEVSDRITVFMFHKELEAEDGAVFPKILRVTVENDTGAILNVSISKAGVRP